MLAGDAVRYLSHRCRIIAHAFKFTSFRDFHWLSMRQFLPAVAKRPVFSAPRFFIAKIQTGTRDLTAFVSYFWHVNWLHYSG